MAEMTEVTKDKLIADVKLVIADSEELLRATAGQAGDKIAEIRARTQDRLAAAKIKLAEAEAAVVDKAKQVGRAADDYVHDNPWRSVGVAAGIGFVSAKGLLGTGVTLLHNRLELLGIELAEERARLFSMLAYGGAAFLCLAAGLVFFAVFLTVLMWDSNRLLALAVFSALFLGAGVVSLLVTLSLARSGSKLFSASLAELRKDTQALTPGDAARPR